MPGSRTGDHEPPVLQPGHRARRDILPDGQSDERLPIVLGGPSGIVLCPASRPANCTAWGIMLSAAEVLQDGPSDLGQHVELPRVVQPVVDRQLREARDPIEVPRSASLVLDVEKKRVAQQPDDGFSLAELLDGDIS